MASCAARPAGPRTSPIWRLAPLEVLREAPKAQFSLKVGTIFEDSAIGLEKWLPALWLLTNCKNGISSYELARALGVTQKTAWFMLSRLRLALAGRERRQAGRPRRSRRNLHRWQGAQHARGQAEAPRYLAGRSMIGKVAVMGLLAAPRRRRRSRSALQVIANRKQAST